MWEAIMGRMPSMMIFFCAVLSSLIPWIIYCINQKLHQYGDPAWKNGSNNEKITRMDND